MKIKLNEKEYLDKVQGCWIGKNIGGTIGAPFEGTQDMPVIEGYTTRKGEPLPNDDLDLQLVWLRALRDVGPLGLDSNVLADYWLTYITPHWGEYGISKGNLFAGLLPPLSGENDNDWKNSNGAWIRSEIWACLCPGIPNLAVKYAIMDASVDHGLSEGTYAEIFTAAFESIAFFESDVRTVINKALEYVPEDSRVARSVKIVLDGYDSKVDWKDVRHRVVEDNVHDLGWFMAPANVAFVVLGLMYGEGDFKKSIIYTVGCGDDTDCTGATCGAVLGIIKGASRLPEDWKDYIGDRIITCCINASYTYVPNIPKSCTELTELVVPNMVSVMNAHGVQVEFTDADSECDPAEADKIYKGYAQNVFSRSPYSFEINTSAHTGVLVEYDAEPQIRAGEPFKVTLTVWNKRRDSHRIEATAILPDGWTAEYQRSFLLHNQGLEKDLFKLEMVITANENIAPRNKITVLLESNINVLPVAVPLVLFG